METYRPLVIVRPDAGTGALDVCGVVECERLFGRDDLSFDVAVLRFNGRACVVFGENIEADFEKFSYDQRGLYGRDAAGGDEENVCVVSDTLELCDELAGHGRGVFLT